MGKQWKQWETLFSWAPKSLQMVTAAVKLQCLLLGRKAMENHDSALKTDITLLTKICLVKAGFSSSHVWMWGLGHKKGWALAFQLWYWRRLLRIPWTAKRSNQSILKEIIPDYSLEGLMVKPQLQYFGHLIQRTDWWKRPWCWERLKAGGEGSERKWDGWMASQT